MKDSFEKKQKEGFLLFLEGQSYTFRKPQIMHSSWDTLVNNQMLLLFCHQPNLPSTCYVQDTMLATYRRG